MKTKFATIIAATALLISTTSLTNANNKTDGGAVLSTSLTAIGSINKIEASGNVDVYIVNGDKDAVKIYNDYYSQNALVQNVDGVLRIASYTTEKLMVLVTVNDLKAITANDNAFVKTYGDALSAKMLDIKLNDKAVAVLKLDVIAANIVIDDQAHAELFGLIENYTLGYNASATVNKSQLQAYASRVSEIKQPKNTRNRIMGFGATASL